MDSRTQWELAGLTLAIAVSGGTFALGLASSNDTVKQLEATVSSYEKLDKVNTEEFIDSVVFTTKELKLSVIERKELRNQKLKISELELEIKHSEKRLKELEELLDLSKQNIEKIVAENNKSLKENTSKYEGLIRAKNEEITTLKVTIDSLQSSITPFSLAEGQGKNLRKGKYQVGVSKIEYGNICNVSINNDIKEMKAGQFIQADECRITLTDCTYNSDNVAKFEMICPQ
ncbi:hypothetical protein PO25_17755 [Vibrio anguillarum]|uniref:hypothetical protein n=1 Tax=Vibrio anguillarum TaxID=55601 RepID=UPI00097E24F2|nr:hypothetical protein [Vibrio anguillarum]ASG01637.1 hypothetical protein CEG15_15905 [Vibrio anguillarum]MBT2949716.1 hypothetical protein [Vibrio anguillarum]